MLYDVSEVTVCRLRQGKLNNKPQGLKLRQE